MRQAESRTSPLRRDSVGFPSGGPERLSLRAEPAAENTRSRTDRQADRDAVDGRLSQMKKSCA